MTFFGIAAGMLKRIGRPFSNFSRCVITFALLAFLVANTYLVAVIQAPPHIDGRSWLDRSLKPLWGQEDYPLRYYYARHHPSLARLVYGGVLHRMGVYESDRPLVNYIDNVGWEWNQARGAYVPLEIRTPLRIVNVAFLAGMILFVYLGMKYLFRNRLSALLGCLPIIFCYPIFTGPAPYTGIAPYLGTDSMLLFWMALYWYAWLRLEGRGLWGVLVLGVVGGLLVSTKVNGAFVLLGACIYYFLSERGWRRLAWPVLLVGIPFVIFVAANPVYWGAPGHVVRTLGRTLELMFQLKSHTAERDWGQFTRWQVIQYSFPYWVFWLPTAAVVLCAKKHKWLWITMAWATPSILLNWFLIYVPFPRYSGPIAMVFLVLFAAAGIHLVTARLREAAAGTPVGFREASEQ